MAPSPLVSLSNVAANAAFVGQSLSRYTGQVPDTTTELTGIVSGLYGLCSSINHFESAARGYGMKVFDGETNFQISRILRECMSLLRDTEMLVQEIELACSTKGAMQKSMLKEASWSLKTQESSLRARLETSKEGMSLLLATLHANAQYIPGAQVPFYEDFGRRLTFNEFGPPDSPVDYRSPTSPLSGLSSGLSSTSPITPRRERAGSFSQRMHERSYFDRGFARALPPNPHFVPPPRPKSAFMPLRNTEFVQYIDPALEGGSDGSNSSQSSDYRYKYAPPPLALPAPRLNYSRRKSQPNIHKLNLTIQVDGFQPEPKVAKPEHWATKVFTGLLSETKLPNIANSQASKCTGKAMEVLRKDTETELLKMKFASDFIVRFWRCEKIRRTRVICQVGRRSSNDRFHSAMDMSWLTIWRSGSILYLKYRNSVWAILSFANIEDLVVFYTTFLVLRQRGNNPPDLEDEVDLDEEMLLYSGLISDDEGGEHILRVFQDEDTRAYRLAAFIKDGDFHQLPVWTAFVTDFIHDDSWLTRRAARVQLSTLHLVSFSDNFSTKTYRNWELLFSEREDAKDFEKVFKEDIRQ